MKTLLQSSKVKCVYFYVTLLMEVAATAEVKGYFHCTSGSHSAITCSSNDLPDISDGSFDCAPNSELLQNHVCMLTCNNGFYPNLSEQAVCEARADNKGGKWSDGNFTCQEIICSTDDLPDVANGSFDCSYNTNKSMGDTCSLRCNDGFYPAFLEQTECVAGEGNQGGVWSEGHFACLAITCFTKDLSDVTNGSFECSLNSNVAFGGACTLKCNEGFYSAFSNKTVCEAGAGTQGGKWSDGDFTCREITCFTNDLPDITNGAFTCPLNSNLSYGDVCVLTCNDTFYPPYLNQTVCEARGDNEDGNWSDGNFACHAITCSSHDLPDITDGSFDCVPNSELLQNHVCMLMCSNGFYPTLSEQAVCEAREDNKGGKWSDGNFTCQDCRAWYQWRGTEYKMTSTTQNADDSNQLCKNEGAFLTSIENQEENEFIQKMVSYCNDNEKTWIGLNDKNEPGSWKWRDGTTVGYTNWANSEPSNDLLEEHVYIKGSNGKWHDYPWFHSLYAVCKRRNH